MDFGTLFTKRRRDIGVSPDPACDNWGQLYLWHSLCRSLSLPRPGRHRCLVSRKIEFGISLTLTGKKFFFWSLLALKKKHRRGGIFCKQKNTIGMHTACRALTTGGKGIGKCQLSPPESRRRVPGTRSGAGNPLSTPATVRLRTGLNQSCLGAGANRPLLSCMSVSSILPALWL